MNEAREIPNGRDGARPGRVRGVADAERDDRRRPRPRVVHVRRGQVVDEDAVVVKPNGARDVEDELRRERLASDHVALVQLVQQVLARTVQPRVEDLELQVRVGRVLGGGGGGGGEEDGKEEWEQSEEEMGERKERFGAGCGREGEE